MPRHHTTVVVILNVVIGLGWATHVTASWRPTPSPLHGIGASWILHQDGSTITTTTGTRRLLRSRDAGRTFDTIHRSELVSLSRLALHPGDPAIMAELGWSPGNTEPRRQLGLSNDGGRTWNVVEVPQDVRELLGFDHRGSIFLGGFGLWRSDDLGQSWIEIERSGTVELYSGARDSVLLVDGDRSGPTLSVSFDGGRRFVDVPSPHGSVQAEWLIAPNDSRHIVAVDDTGGTDLIVTEDGFASWRSVERPGYDVELQIHPRRARWLFAREANPNDSSSTIVHVSKDFGSHWTSFEMAGTDPSAPLIFDPCADDVFFAVRTSDDGWFRATTDGDPTALDVPTPRMSILSAAARTVGCEILISTRTGLFAVTEQGERWTKLGVGLPTAPVFDSHFDRHRPGLVWAATSGGLLRSTDGGRSWSVLRTLEGLGIFDVSSWPDTGRLVVLDDSRRLLVSDVLGASFIDTGRRGLIWLPDPFVAGAGLLFSSDGWLRISEFGQQIVGRPDFGGADVPFELAFDPQIPGRVVAHGGTLQLSV
ncbi:MAG: hypothetical protein AAGE94_22090, partial [Acidobacteriota bacterium]